MTGIEIGQAVTIKGGFTFIAWRGRVLETRSKTETNVYSSGGSGYVYNGMGSFHQGSTETINTEHNEIWLQDEDGTEQSFRYADENFPVRQGHLVTVVMGSKPGSDEALAVILVNHTTNYVAMVKSSIEYLAPRRLRVPISHGFLRFIFVVFGVALVVIGGNVAALFVGGFILTAIALKIYLSLRRNNVVDYLEDLHTQFVAAIPPRHNRAAFGDLENMSEAELRNVIQRYRLDPRNETRKFTRNALELFIEKHPDVGIGAAA